MHKVRVEESKRQWKNVCWTW